MGQIVSANFFDVLGVRAFRGRTFLPEEDQGPGKHPVVEISHGLWQRRFGGDPAIVGKSVTLNNQPFTIIGVAPAGFQGSDTAMQWEFWVPMMMTDTSFSPGARRLESRGNRWFSALARLKPGVGVEQARAEMNGIAAQLAKEYPATMRASACSSARSGSSRARRRACWGPC